MIVPLMTLWLLVSHDGTSVRKYTAQGDVHKHLGGPVTFVGAIPSADAFVVARSDCELPMHVWNGKGLFFEGSEVRGPIAIVASDDKGDEIDLNLGQVFVVLQRLA